MIALILVVLFLHLVVATAVGLAVELRLQRHEREVAARLAITQAPVLTPDPRVDELVRIVGTLRGAEALKQTFGR